MKILELSIQDRLSIPGIWREWLDYNERYRAFIVYLQAGVETGIYSNNHNIVQTFYVLEGNLKVKVYDSSKSSLIGGKEYKENQGWSLLPEQAQQLETAIGCAVFVVSGEVAPDQLVDGKTGRNPIKRDRINELNDYLVTKPWGYEQWLVENGVYVLKGITMNVGSECSMQIHEQKNEFNLVLRGRVRVSMSEDEQIKKAIKAHRLSGKDQATFSVNEEDIARIKQNMQSVIISKYEGWKARPFQIHQVFSKETYFALEVSTPEVDDIIRLKDLYNRTGGRIVGEHQQNHGL